MSVNPSGFKYDCAPPLHDSSAPLYPFIEIISSCARASRKNCSYTEQIVYFVRVGAHVRSLHCQTLPLHVAQPRGPRKRGGARWRSVWSPGGCSMAYASAAATHGRGLTCFALSSQLAPAQLALQPSPTASPRPSSPTVTAPPPLPLPPCSPLHDPPLPRMAPPRRTARPPRSPWRGRPSSSSSQEYATTSYGTDTRS